MSVDGVPGHRVARPCPLIRGVEVFVKLSGIVPVHTRGALSVDGARGAFRNLLGVFIKHSYVVSEVEFFGKHDLSPVREWELFRELIFDCLAGAHFLYDKKKQCRLVVVRKATEFHSEELAYEKSEKRGAWQSAEPAFA